jgi:hypothetical protein
MRELSLAERACLARVELLALEQLAAAAGNAAGPAAGCRPTGDQAAEARSVIAAARRAVVAALPDRGSSPAGGAPRSSAGQSSLICSPNCT